MATSTASSVLGLACWSPVGLGLSCSIPVGKQERDGLQLNHHQFTETTGNRIYLPKVCMGLAHPSDFHGVAPI